MGIVLSGGTVVTAADCFEADVRIEEEKITAVGVGIRHAADKVLDVTGCLLLPGGIDPHTHFDLPVGETVTADDFGRGSKAALLGGTTTIIDFATQFKGETLSRALANWHEKAAGKTFTDYGFHMAITDWNEAVRREMGRLVDTAGVSSFKLYMAYKNTLQVDDAVLLQALRRSRECGALVCLHCENGDIIDSLVREALAEGKTAPRYHPVTRPAAAEREATVRAITLAEVAQAPVYIVHLTCSLALEEVVKAKGRGVEVYAETCPQYLLLDESYYQKEGFEGAKYVISPPLRPRENQASLWNGLRSGALDTIATDHCAFNFQGQKELGRSDFSKIPNGMPGVETRLGLLYTYGVVPGRISLSQFVALTSTQPAKLFGLFPRKGAIAAGSDADIVVWDPNRSALITAAAQQEETDYAPFEGFGQQGKAVQVFLRGRQVVRDGQLIEDRPGGIYLSRKPFRARKGGDIVQHKP